MIKLGSKAPLDISIVDTKSSSVSLKDLLGSYVVLYAYPKDETPGCIKEACSIRDVYSEFKALGVAVIGLSPDSGASHQKFIDKHELNFPLWADTKQELLTALGVWGEKSMWGKKYTGVLRTTFLIDKEGTIVHIWEKVKPEGHGEEVLDFVANLLKK